MIETSRDEWEVVSAFEIMKYLEQKNFSDINHLLLFETGKPFHRANGKLYVKQEYEAAAKLDSIDDIRAAARLLAAFHLEARGFSKPAGIRIRTEWGKQVEKYKLMLTRVRKFYRKTAAVNEFEKTALEYKPGIMQLAEASEQFFRSGEYLRLLENSMMSREIGLVSVDETTFVRANGRLSVSNILDAAYNVAVEDLVKLMRKSNGWRGIGGCVCETVFKEYERIRPLEAGELEMAVALLYFPYESIKYILRYQENPKMERQLLEKLVKSHEREEENKWGEAAAINGKRILG